jgi:hypothetical protein
MVASKSKEIRAAIRIFMAITLSQYSGEITPLRRNQPTPAVGYWPWNAASRCSPQLCKQLPLPAAKPYKSTILHRQSLVPGLLLLRLEELHPPCSSRMALASFTIWRPGDEKDFVRALPTLNRCGIGAGAGGDSQQWWASDLPVSKS